MEVPMPDIKSLSEKELTEQLTSKLSKLALANIVHELKQHEAASINKSGPDKQAQYIVKAASPEWVLSRLRTEEQDAKAYAEAVRKAVPVLQEQMKRARNIEARFRASGKLPRLEELVQESSFVHNRVAEFLVESGKPVWRDPRGEIVFKTASSDLRAQALLRAVSA